MSDLVAYARDLEAEDAALAEAIAEINLVWGEISQLRSRAEHVVSFRALLPEARTALAARLGEAEEELDERRAEAAEAEARLERAQKEVDVLEARRAVVRTQDTVTTAEAKVARFRDEAEALETEAERIEADFPELEQQAAVLEGRLGGLRRAADPGDPDGGAAGIAAWASRAEASLFVARGGLETERDRLVRQANELAASALGETLASSVSRVREQLERRLS